MPSPGEGAEVAMEKEEEAPQMVDIAAAEKDEASAVKNDEEPPAEEGATAIEKDAPQDAGPQDSGTTVRKEPLELSFENISVYVPGKKVKHCCACIDGPMRSFGAEYLGVGVQNRAPFYSLDLINGACKLGEMVLVLGSNGVSKSSLLRLLAGRLNKEDELSGAILLNGMPLGKSNQGWRRMTAYVAATDASHAPVLTVRETLEFATKCTSDGKQSQEYINGQVDRLLKLLGLYHVADTVVGDENLRGVSGGQKRRVTVGEMMTDPGMGFFCCENITDGLASTDSEVLIENLRSASNTLGTGGLISLLQPSDIIVEKFDKLLVLSSNGELMYFGPVDRSAIRSVFLGGEEPATSHGSICDLVLEQESEDEIIDRFAASEIYAELVQSLAHIRVTAPPARDRNLDALLPEKKYSSSRGYQFKVLAGRKLKLIVRNAVTYTRVLIAIVFGIIIGSLFGVLKNDIAGSLARTGYLFLNSFLVLMLSSAITIPDSFRMRITTFKQRSAEFYSGRASYLVQVIMDMPLSILEATLLSTISYFWVDMNPGASHFFYFWGALVGLECVGQAYARLLSALIRKQVSASALSSISILVCGTVGGFMPTYNQIPWVLRWLSWFTPVAYAFEGMMINEFSGRSIQGLSLGNEDGDTTSGLIPGQSWLDNYNIPRASWGTLGEIKIFDLFMIYLFAVLYDLIGFYFVEHTRGWSLNQSRRPQARVRSDYLSVSGQTKKTVADSQHLASEVTPCALEEDKYPETLCVRNLTYSVPLKKGPKRCTKESVMGPCLAKFWGKKVTKPEAPDDKSELTLLDNVDAFFQRSHMTCLMGPSGCGKTTLMDVIAGYKTGGKISGDILIDGRPKNDKVWKKIAGYAEQMDILNPYLSVMETLNFTAVCRLGKNGGVNEVIEQVVRLMGLQEWTDMIIGRELEGEGLPKHARKRVTIAVQLVGKPKILFLDEPTTGLGTKAASLVTKAIRRSTDALGLVTLATIHQPSKSIWDTFDDILLLTKGGKVAYMGEMGPNSQSVLGHFAAMTNVEPPTSCNPADFVLECLTDVSTEKAVSAFEISSNREELVNKIEGTKDGDSSSKEPTNSGRPISFFMEFLLLFKRHVITQWRNPSYSMMRLICSVSASIYMGILFYGDKTSSINGAVSSIGAVFFFVFILVIPMQAGVVPLVEDRAVLYRETVSGTYSRLAYGLGLMFADIPFHMLNALLMFVSFYYLVGFGRDGDQQGYFLLMVFMANFVIMSLGQLFALASPNEESANGLAGLAIILSVILMGFLITVDAMPSGWVWAYWANLLRYILQGLVTNELAGTTYKVDLSGLLPKVTEEAPDATQLLVFGPGVDSQEDRTRQAATLLTLVAETRGGINPAADTRGDLSSLVDCLISNDCFVDPAFSSFIGCTIFAPFQSPICGEEFDIVTEGIDPKDIEQCFLSSGDTEANGVPSNFSLEEFEGEPRSDQRETVLCLMRALLPPGAARANNLVSTLVDDLFGIIIAIIDIIKNGIQLPGELILYFFGWAKFDDGEFVAPWKWYYCMFSVAIFIGAIELFKLFSVSFIVWIKR